MWRCRNNAFRGDGAFGQYAIVMPGQDAVIAITSETPDMQGELNLIWKILLPAMRNGKLPANKTAAVALQQKLASLSLPIKNDPVTASFAKLEGKTYRMDSNPQQIQSMSFDFQNNRGQLTLKAADGNYTFSFGANEWQNGQTTLPGPYLVSAAKNNLAGLPPFKVAGEYSWLDANTLELVLRYIESPHTETLLCRFEGDKLTVEVKRSFNNTGPGAVVTLTGTRQ